MKFQVITKVPDPLEPEHAGGNAALAMPLYYDEKMDGNLKLVDMEHGALMFRQCVFTLGEVVIVDESGREIVGPLRKADKWDITYETFDTVEAAVERAQQL